MIQTNVMVSNKSKSLEFLFFRKSYQISVKDYKYLCCMCFARGINKLMFLMVTHFDI